MSREDIRILNSLKKRIRKYKGFRFFLASKRGGNTKGNGKNRSVILAKYPEEKDWFQFAKIWGENNEKRANKIIQEANN